MQKKTKSLFPAVLAEPYPTPAFLVHDTHGKEITQQTLLGQWVVVYFYPKDMTSGCTVQARDFEAAKQKFAKLDCIILGVSKDPCSSHEKFMKKEGLTFTLLSDKEFQMCESFEVWKEKSMYGKKYMGIERTTFIMNPAGNIVAKWPKVKVNGHIDDVLCTLQSLQG